jgi:hypothetical protein
MAKSISGDTISTAGQMRKLKKKKKSTTGHE